MLRSAAVLDMYCIKPLDEQAIVRAAGNTNAVAWQCARAADICRRVEQTGAAEKIRTKTGLALSPYFPASKLVWLKENVEGAKDLAEKHELCFGTIDTWLVYKMTHGASYKTDYSNASRTQLFDIFEKTWDEEICQLFGLDAQDLAEVCDSDSCFGGKYQLYRSSDLMAER